MDALLLLMIMLHSVCIIFFEGIFVLFHYILASILCCCFFVVDLRQNNNDPTGQRKSQCNYTYITNLYSKNDFMKKTTKKKMRCVEKSLDFHYPLLSLLHMSDDHSIALARSSMRELDAVGCLAVHCILIQFRLLIKFYA